MAWAPCAERWRLPLPELVGATRIDVGATRIDMGTTRIDVGTTWVDVGTTWVDVSATWINAGRGHRNFAGRRGQRDQQGGDEQPCLSHDSILGRGSSVVS